MSLQTIPYQPLPFDFEPNCTLPCAPWIQKIERGDRTSVQFKYGACDAAGNMLVGGDFSGDGSNWTQIGTWTFNGGVATSPIAASGQIEQTVEMEGVDYVELTFSAVINNGSLVITTDGGYLTYYTTGGIITVVIPVSGDTLINFWFNTSAGGSISNIILKPINTRVRLDVVELNDNIVATIPDSWFTFNAGFLTANFNDWDSLALPDSCYKLAVYDPCECSQFGFIGDNFDVPNQFKAVTGLSNVVGGVMYSLTAPSSQTQLRSRALLCPNVEYTFTYTINGLAGNGDYFQLRIGTANGIQRTVDGTYTETLTTTFTGDIEVRYIFNHGTGVTHQMTLTDFSMEAVDPIVSYYSETFSLKDDHKCTVLIEACGVGEEFNFGFNGTGFKPIIRLEGIYRGANFPTTRTDYEYSTGQRNAPYMRTRKAKTLFFGGVEYVHDWSSLWLGLSNLYIDGIAKFCEDSEPPTVSLEDDMDLGFVTFTFSDKVELTEKRSCTTLPNTGCSDDGYALAIESTGGFKLDLPVLASQGRILAF